MKKNLNNIVLSIILLIFYSVNTTACNACNLNNLKYYTQFINRINNKETFIMEISGYECNTCQGFKIGSCAELYDYYNENNYNDNLCLYIPNQQFKKYLDGKVVGQPSNLSIDGALAGRGIKLNKIEKEKIKNAKLISTYKNYKTSNDAFSEKWIKKLFSWVIEKDRSFNKLPDGNIDYTITVESLNLKQDILFIFIKDGNYHGISYGISDKIGLNPQVNEYIKMFISHIVLGIWNTNNK